jgi:hypothetical protein
MYKFAKTHFLFFYKSYHLVTITKIQLTYPYTIDFSILHLVLASPSIFHSHLYIGKKNHAN